MSSLKKLFALSLPIVLLAACSAPTADVGMDASSSAALEDTSSSAMMDNSSSSVEAVSGATEERVIDVTADNWNFEPSAITVKQGETVRLRISSAAGIHGFAIPDLEISSDSIEPGETIEIEIPTDTAGTFAFRCNVPCGEGHREMTGSIVIEA